MKTRYRGYRSNSRGYWTTALVDQRSERQERDKGLFPPDAELMWEIDADTPEEADAIYYLRRGFGACMPMGEAEPCPKCGAIYYPMGSGVCWRCGPVSPCQCGAHAETEGVSGHELLERDDLHGRPRYKAYRLGVSETGLFDSQAEEDARRKGLLPHNAQLLWEIEAATPEEAMAIYCLRMGLTPYAPRGDSAHCPKCGATYYPEDSGVCWRCGLVPQGAPSGCPTR